MNPLALDTIYARRPALTYVCPAICEAIFSSSSFPSLILDAVDPRNSNKITGVIVTYSGGGDYLINFNNYPGALCYSVYKLNDANDPFSGYTIIAECITDPIFDPKDWFFPPPTPGTPQCFVMTAITADGETDFSDEICVFNPPDPGTPPPTGTGCIISNAALPDGAVDENYSVTLLPNGVVNVPQWTIYSGALPPGLTLNIDSGIISGIPTTGGDFSFVVVLSKNGGAPCSKAFTIHIEEEESCSDPNNTTYIGSSGTIASGLNVTLPSAEFRFGAPGDGYGIDSIPDGTPRIAVATVNWGATPETTVLVAPSPGLSGTTLTLQAGQGALFPAGSLPILAYAYNGTQSPTDEIIQITGVAGDDLTIVRAQSGTSASDIGVGWTVKATMPFFPWLVAESAESGDGTAFGSMFTAFNANSTKALRIPVFPGGTSVANIFASSPDGASGTLMGDCSVSVEYDCVTINDLLAVTWDSPDIVEAELGSASGSASGASFNVSVSNPGGGLDEANAALTGSFVCNGNGVAGKLTITVSDFNLDSGGDWPRFEITADSSLDGANVWACLRDNLPEWLTGNGVYEIPVVIPCTPGAVITLNVLLETVQGLGENQSLTISGTFSAW